MLTKRGNYVPHSYTEDKFLSWWDDVFFPLGSQLIAVYWTHPRTRYKDEVESASYDELVNRRPLPKYDLFEQSTPIYRKLGKSGRKRVVAWRLPTTISSDVTEWNEQWQQVEKQMLVKSDIVVEPSMYVKQMNWARVVHICTPIEINSREDVEGLAELVKDVLTGAISFESCYPSDYSYSCNDWVRDMEYMNKMLEVNDASV
jgi:hypothetical protein